MSEVSARTQIPISTISGVVQVFRNTGRTRPLTRRGWRKPLQRAVAEQMLAWKRGGISVREISAKLHEELGIAMGKSQVGHYLAELSKPQLRPKLGSDACIQVNCEQKFVDIGTQYEFDVWDDEGLQEHLTP